MVRYGLTIGLSNSIRDLRWTHALQGWVPRRQLEAQQLLLRKAGLAASLCPRYPAVQFTHSKVEPLTRGLSVNKLLVVTTMQDAGG